jgi:hypothetical protein
VFLATAARIRQGECLQSSADGALRRRRNARFQGLAADVADEDGGGALLTREIQVVDASPEQLLSGY